MQGGALTAKRLRSQEEGIEDAREDASALTPFVHLLVQPQRPASWSVLGKTIPRLFRLDPEVLESISSATDRFPASALNLPDEEWAKLGRAGIYKDDAFCVLLSLSIGYLLHLRVSRRTFDNIVDAFKMLCDRFGVPTASLEVPEGSEILADTEIAKIGGFRIDSFNVQRELADELGQRGFTLWRDLTNNTEKGILESSGLTWDSVKLIYLLWHAKAYAGQISTKISKYGSHGSFVNMVETFVASGSRKDQDKDRDKTVMLGRLGLLDGRKWTLDELGKRVGLTRERIRQIEAGLLKRLRHPSRSTELELFRWAVGETLRLAGGVCFPSELKRGVTEKLQWEREPNEQAFALFTELFGRVKVKESGLEYVYDPSHKCVDCDTVVSALNSVFAQTKREKSISEVAGFLLSRCANTPECDRKAKYLAFSGGFVSFVADKSQDVLVEDDTVYSHSTWTAKYGTRVQFVEGILLAAGHPMHFNEVHEQAITLRPDDERISEHNVHSWLGQSENILRWERGTFVHCDHVSVPPGLIREIETWFVEKLISGIPFIYIRAAFDVFIKQCEECKISSESALYACMRRGDSSQLLYPRYPQVYLRGNFESRISPHVALERFILDEGAEVSYQTLSEYSNELGLKVFQFDQSLSKLSNVVRTQRDGFVHIACLEFDFRKFGGLLAFVRDLLQKFDQVSIIKVFNDKPVSCADLGIDSPKMFFEVPSIGV